MACEVDTIKSVDWRVNYILSSHDFNVLTHLDSSNHILFLTTKWVY